MDIRQHIGYWLKSAAHDLEVTEALFQNHEYDWYGNSAILWTPYRIISHGIGELIMVSLELM